MIKIFILIFIFNVDSFAQESKLLEDLEVKINSSLEEKFQLLVEKQEIESQIQELQIKIKERRVFLLKRLKAFNRLNSFQWGELLTEPNLKDLTRKLKILKNMNEYDFQIFKDYNLSLKQLAQARKNLADTETQMKKNIKTYQKRQVDFHKLESIRIQTLLNNKSDSLLLSQGKLSRPLEGMLKQEFGTLRDQFRQYYLVNRGELYATRAGAPIKVIGPGVIIFDDDLNRWRETLIVQHADNYYSVYAGVKKAAKKLGDSVVAGEILGLSSKNEFYFELRHFASPINPKPWYKE